MASRFLSAAHGLALEAEQRRLEESERRLKLRLEGWAPSPPRTRDYLPHWEGGAAL